VANPGRLEPTPAGRQGELIMRTSALLFMLGAWTFVIGLVSWAYWRMLRTPRDEGVPPPGSLP
jgi:hypothetical protein